LIWHNRRGSGDVCSTNLAIIVDVSGDPMVEVCRRFELIVAALKAATHFPQDDTAKPGIHALPLRVGPRPWDDSAKYRPVHAIGCHTLTRRPASSPHGLNSSPSKNANRGDNERQ